MRNTLISLWIVFSWITIQSDAQAQHRAKVWKSGKEPLREIEAIRKQLVKPTFRDKDYDITDFGAKGDGVTINTETIRAVIEQCHAEGGGRVIVPGGRFMTGPIYLKSNVNLHLHDEATLVFSADTKDYPLVLTRWEGMDCMNYSPQFYAYEEENIAITGGGTIDGNGSKTNWWLWKGRKNMGWMEGEPDQKAAREKLHEMMKARINPRERIFGDGHYLRPYMYQPYKCKNLFISGVRMINSPMWFISPVMCENVIIEGVNVRSVGPNTDGCDPDACKNVWIKDSFFNTGDDCIAIKSGRDEDGRGHGIPAENILIENCEMKNGHGGVVIGSEIAGGARNIYAINCNMDSPHLDRVLRIKTSSSRGGIIENIFMKDIRVGKYKESALHFNMFYENPGDHIPAIRNIWVEDMQVTEGGQYAIFVNAYEESPVENLRLVNCTINGVKENANIDHVKKMQFKNVRINGKKKKPSDLVKQ